MGSSPIVDPSPHRVIADEPFGKVAIVHDFFGVYGGAERMAAAIADMFPTAPIYTSVVTTAAMPAGFPVERLRPAWFNAIPGAGPNYRLMLPLIPIYFSRLDLSAYDLVISSSIAFAKAVITRPGALHICYCYTPNRYAWQLDEYLNLSGLPWWSGIGARAARSTLQDWDRRMGVRPDVMVAISREVQRRIAATYGRSSHVVHPFVDINRFSVTSTVSEPKTPAGQYLLVVARLIGYKRIDLAIAAANQLGLPLKIVGRGPAEAGLRRLAGTTVEFLGQIADKHLLSLYLGCSAFLFPGLEDFGIAPLEAGAAGRPVVAFAGGGALDTVVEGLTGILFREQTVESLAGAIRQALEVRWDSSQIRAHAAKFALGTFQRQFTAVIDSHRSELATPK